MSVINRRNALFGWVVYQVGIRVIKQKAKAAVPTIDTESKRPNKSAIALAAATAVGVVDVLEEALGRRRLVAC